ncbi:MAG: hypothetical protein KDE48_12100 [Anaerolineales bacterium]|nr:hypothetical protein [Anaerolineales bacterium]
MTQITQSIDSLLKPLIRIHASIRDAVVAACENINLETLTAVAHEAEGDTIYAIDRISETRLIDLFSQEIAPHVPIILIGEGLPDGKVVLPLGTAPEEAVWRIIVDPIDGTRGLMYQKRPGWILTGVAPNLGPETNLQAIDLAIQTEIPLLKQHLADVLWAVRGQGATAVRHNRLTGEDQPLVLRPSQAHSIAHGFAMISRFFPSARDELAAIDEEIVRSVLGPVQPGKAHCFEDQYICSGGQLYEMMVGHDRFVADIRPLLEQHLAQQGLALGICCHPYDLCTELIAHESGIIVCDAHGQAVNPVLNVNADVTWIAYANPHIRTQIEPHLRKALQRRGWIE